METNVVKLSRQCLVINIKL